MPFEEDFETYSEATFSLIRDLIDEEKRDAGVFGLRMGGKFSAMCQLNKAGLPRYSSPVLRVCHITLSPEYDLTDKPLKEYAEVLINLLMGVLEVAHVDEIWIACT